MQYDPVCGRDGQTYSNACVAGCAGVEFDRRGVCPEVEPDEPACSLVQCRMACLHGFATDSNGCEVCQCNPAPNDGDANELPRNDNGGETTEIPGSNDGGEATEIPGSNGGADADDSDR